MSNPITSRPLLSEALGREGVYARKWGEKVQDAREALNLSRNQLAQLVDVDASTVWKIENGRRLPSDALKCAIASALGRPVDRLFPMPSIDDINEHYLSDEYHARRKAILAATKVAA